MATAPSSSRARTAGLPTGSDSQDAADERRRAVAGRYLAGLRNLEDLGLALPVVPMGADPVWHVFVVRHSQREALQDRLAAVGVECLVHPLPLDEHLANEILSLPMGPHLTDEQVETVVAAVRQAVLELAVAVPSQTRSPTGRAARVGGALTLPPTRPADARGSGG